jgi:hypothetical protein
MRKIPARLDSEALFAFAEHSGQHPLQAPIETVSCKPTHR